MVAESSAAAINGANPTSNAETRFDFASAIARLGGDEELFAELATLFQTEGPQAVQQIAEACAAGEADTVHRLAHGLRGAASYVGGQAVAATAHRIEVIGVAGELATVPDLLLLLRTEVARLTAALASR